MQAIRIMPDITHFCLICIAIIVTYRPPVYISSRRVITLLTRPYFTAKENNIPIIITRNVKDYKEKDLIIQTADEFIRSLEKKGLRKR